MLRKFITPGLVLASGLMALVVGPAILVLPAIFPALDFSTTGQIGDTIGGLTAPIVNTMGAILVYFAFKAQVKANNLLQTQIEEQKLNRKEDNESETLFEIYGYLVEAIDNFQFAGFHLHELSQQSSYRRARRDGERWQGSQAIYVMLDQIRCHYHGPDDELDRKQEVAELVGLLRIMELLLARLMESANENKPMLVTLIEHQFRYRIMTGLKDCPIEDLAKEYCEGCQQEHGIPGSLLEILKSIDHSLNNLTVCKTK